MPGVISIGWREGVETGLMADDRDRRVAETGEVLRQLSLMSSAPVFIVRYVVHVMQPVLDRPVPAQQGQQVFAGRLLRAQRSHRIDGLDARLPGLHLVAFAHATHGLSAMRQFHEAVPLRSLQVNAPTPARLDPSMPFIQGTVFRRAHLRLVPIDRIQAPPHRRLVALDRHHIIRSLPHDREGRLALRVRRVQRDHLVLQLKSGDQLAHGRDLVTVLCHRLLPEHHARLMGDRRDQHRALRFWQLPGGTAPRYPASRATASGVSSYMKISLG